MHKQILKSKNGPAPGNAKTILSFCNMEALEPRKDYNEMNEVTSVQEGAPSLSRKEDGAKRESMNMLGKILAAFIKML